VASASELVISTGLVAPTHFLTLLKLSQLYVVCASGEEMKKKSEKRKFSFFLITLILLFPSQQPLQK
jgi:hypothetical protein